MMPQMKISDILIEVPKWVFTFLAIVVVLVIIYSMFVASCTTYLFGLEFGSNRSCDEPKKNSLISQIVTRKLISDLTTPITNKWSSNLVELEIEPTKDDTKLIISANGSIASESSSEADPHNVCYVGIFLEDEIIAASGTGFIHQKNGHVIPFNIEGEYLPLDKSKQTFSLKLWQRRDTKCTLQFSQDNFTGPGLFKILEISEN